MKPRFVLTVLSSAIVLIVCAQAQAFQKIPTWLQQASALQHKSYEKNVPAVVLHREKTVSLEGSSKLVTTERRVVKILNRDGRKEAVGIAFYLSKFSSVTDIEAWLIAPGGAVKSYGKKEIIDQISDPDDIYDEGRIKIIDGSSDADVGYIFGFTATVEDKPLFFQDKWNLQDELPTLVSRYSLSLPEGWKAKSVTFNGPEIAPRQSGNSYNWEARDLAPIPIEPNSPSFANLAPLLAINYAPPAGGTGTFSNWKEVSMWGTGLFEPQVVVNDAIAIKARELTAGAKTEIEKIRAIGNFVQNLQYISIDIGVGYGNGMKPRPSDLVLGRGYGDCKDKANLMRALLKVLKIEAYPIAIYSGDPNFVRVEWASPSQFNHCIIAIRVSADTNSPTVLEHPKLGRLMIFDATDPYTPVGDLPEILQGSYGVVMAGENGDIVRMPTTPAEMNHLDRNVEVALTQTGDISAKLNERSIGSAAAYERARMRELSPTEYSRVIGTWISRAATGATTSKIAPKDDHQQGRFDLDVDFNAGSYAQLMQGRLMVFKPAVVGRLEKLRFSDGQRANPYMIDATKYSESVRIKLPPGFVVDEVPDATNLETTFGKYSTNFQLNGDSILFTRSLTLNRATIPAEKYDGVKAFFSKIRDAEQSPVVLIKK